MGEIFDRIWPSISGFIMPGTNNEQVLPYIQEILKRQQAYTDSWYRYLKSLKDVSLPPSDAARLRELPQSLRRIHKNPTPNR